MEFVEGGTLTERLRDANKSGKMMSLEEISKIISQVSQALDYAHKQDLIHRDIKPSNVLLAPGGDVFLTDFGIARMMGGTQFTATGALIGTPAYMSPEQCKGLETTPVSDIYSLGIILYEMFTGGVPFEAETPLSVLQKHITEPVPILREHRTDLPIAFEEVIAKALAKEPEDRYQSAIALAEALNEAIKAEGGIPETLSEAASGEEDETVQPTVVMEEVSEPDPTTKPTEVMETEVEETMPEPEPIKETPTPVVEKAKHVKKPKNKPKKQPKPKSDGVPLMNRIPWKIVIPVVAVVIIGMVLAIVFSGGGGCSDLDDCIAKAGEAAEVGAHEDAAYFYERAAEYVPDDEHREFAWIWCARAEVLWALGLDREAEMSHAICGEWEGE
jgi:serine/threonine protein kinase